MALIHTALFVDDIAALKALNNTSNPKRVDKMFLGVGDDGTGFSAWYRYKQSASDAESLPKIVASNDNVGRWFQFSGGGGGGGATFGGSVICTSSCEVGGKAFKFLAPQTNLKLLIKVGFDINIQTGSSAIAVYRWSQEPNTPRTGQESTPAATISQAGGEVTVNITSTFRWISVYAKNPSNSNYLDGTCFTVNGNVITLVGYS
jgi:hypothetical protein